MNIFLPEIKGLIFALSVFTYDLFLTRRLKSPVNISHFLKETKGTLIKVYE